MLKSETFFDLKKFGYFTTIFVDFAFKNCIFEFTAKKESKLKQDFQKILRWVKPKEFRLWLSGLKGDFGWITSLCEHCQ